MVSYGYESWILVGSWIFMGLICWACFVQLWKTYHEKEVRMLKYFALFFAHLGMFFVIIGSPIFFQGGTLSPAQLGAFYVIGHLFLYFSFAYYSRIPAYIWRPEWEMKVFGLNLLAGAIITAVSIAYWGGFPALISIMPTINPHDIVGSMIAILAILNWGVGGAYLFGKMAYSRTGNERVKFVLLSVGLLMLVISRPLQDVVGRELTTLLIGNVLAFLGVLYLIGGIYFKRIFGSDSVN